jgi:hypothetical protein
VARSDKGHLRTLKSGEWQASKLSGVGIAIVDEEPDAEEEDDGKSVGSITGPEVWRIEEFSENLIGI